MTGCQWVAKLSSEMGNTVGKERVNHLVKSDLRENVIFYQPLSHSEQQPLIIVFSSPWQIDQLKKYGPEMIYLDATYKGITQYGFAFYAVVVKSNHGRGGPCCFLPIERGNFRTVFTMFAEVARGCQSISAKVIIHVH